MGRAHVRTRHANERKDGSLLGMGTDYKAGAGKGSIFLIVSAGSFPFEICTNDNVLYRAWQRLKAASVDAWLSREPL